MENIITATLQRTSYQTWRVRIQRGAEVCPMTPYEVTNKTKAQAVVDFINNMHSETREGWFTAWTAF